MSARCTRFVRSAFALALLAVAGCGSSSSSDRSAKAPAVEAPMPTGNGTKRALVLVEGDAPTPKKAATPQDAALSTPRILQKVLGAGER